VNRIPVHMEQGVARRVDAGASHGRPPGLAHWNDGPSYLLAECWGRFIPKTKARLLAGRFANISNMMKREHLSQDRRKRLFALSPRNRNLAP
jgi:hypothetical protein